MDGIGWELTKEGREWMAGCQMYCICIVSLYFCNFQLDVYDNEMVLELPVLDFLNNA